MLAAILMTGALALSQGAVRDTYTERNLCDLWAGARCHVTSCQPDGKERCLAESKRCRDQDRSEVSRSRAAQVASCARALLKASCGAPQPPECEAVSGY